MTTRPYQLAQVHFEVLLFLTGVDWIVFLSQCNFRSYLRLVFPFRHFRFVNLFRITVDSPKIIVSPKGVILAFDMLMHVFIILLN